MYKYASDILKAMKISPEDVMLIRHTDTPTHNFRRALEAGHVKDYTAMQKTGFAKDVDYLMVFLGEESTTARYFATYYIANRFQSRADHAPEDYPNRDEVEAEGEYLELQECPLPKGVKGFVIDWGGSARMWHQQATTEKPIMEITLTMAETDS